MIKFLSKMLEESPDWGASRKNAPPVEAYFDQFHGRYRIEDATVIAEVMEEGERESLVEAGRSRGVSLVHHGRVVHSRRWLPHRFHLLSAARQMIHVT